MNKKKLYCEDCGEFIAQFNEEENYYIPNLPKNLKTTENRKMAFYMPVKITCKKHPTFKCEIKNVSEINNCKCSICKKANKLGIKPDDDAPQDTITIFTGRVNSIECINAIINCPKCGQLHDLEVLRKTGKHIGMDYSAIKS